MSAVARGPGEVVGFARVFGDGVFQAHPGLLAVDGEYCYVGVGRGLVEEAFARVGAERMALTSSDEGPGFYRSLKLREQVGFRIYPENEGEEG